MDIPSHQCELVSCLPRLWRYCIGLTQERAAADNLVHPTVNATFPVKAGPAIMPIVATL